MERFTRLFSELDSSNKTSTKVSALRQYFREVPPEDGAWAVFFLTGNRLKRAVKSGDFRKWGSEVSGIPVWMLEECYGHVGDLAETLSLLLAGKRSGKSVSQARDSLTLYQVVDDYISPLVDDLEDAKRDRLVRAWDRLEGHSLFVFNKLITGGFRVGVSKTLVVRALAEVAGVEPAIMAHRLMGNWRPLPTEYARLFEPDLGLEDPSRPFPFCLAYPLELSETAAIKQSLGNVNKWQVEWKWDGIRAQLIRRGSEVILWSRGEEIVGEQFPEVQAMAEGWDVSIVLDGELLAWDATLGRPLPFSALQRRLGRSKVGKKLLAEVPVIFMAYDVLEFDAVDVRERTTQARRELLESFFKENRGACCLCSQSLNCTSWEDVSLMQQNSRKRMVEGLMLKRRDALYGSGRKKGDWWKWKVAPYMVDAVMVYAQQGHGRRAGLYTDYTFSLWRGDELVTFAKAYSGLTDAEIRKVDRWIRAHTRETHGPVRVVDPELVFELAFEGIAESKRHKSGIAVRFPRIHRWREDKTAKEADSIETVQGLLKVGE